MRLLGLALIATLLAACGSNSTGNKSKPVSSVLSVASAKTQAAASVAASASAPVTVTAAAVATATAATAVATPDAQALYTKLLTSNLPASLLPEGFSNPKTGQSVLIDADKRHHGVGSVEIDLSGPDPQDALVLTVYATASDAAARFKEPPQIAAGEKLTSDTAAPGFSQPSLLTSGSVTGKNALGTTVTNGFTGCYVLVGDVIVAGANTSTDNDSSGNVPAAIALAKAGIQYLQSLEAQ